MDPQQQQTPEDVDMEDTSTTTEMGGAVPRTRVFDTTTRARVTIPSVEEINNLMVIRATQDRKGAHRDEWQVVEPSQVLNIVGDRIVGEGPATDTESKSDAIRSLRHFVYANTKARMEFMARALIKRGLPGLDKSTIDCEKIVQRFASELAAWPVYNETPPTLLKQRQQHANPSSPDFGITMIDEDSEEGPSDAMEDVVERAASSSDFAGVVVHDKPNGNPDAAYVAPLLQSSRERDAKRLLEARTDKDSRALPASNQAIRDLRAAKVARTPATPQKMAAEDAVVTMLAKELIGLDPKTGRPKQGTIMLARARDLAMGDGVFLAKRMVDNPKDQAVARAILVRAGEVEHMLRSPGDKMDPFMRDTKARIDAWGEQHALMRDHDQGFNRTSLSTATMAALFANPPSDAHSMGYECSKRGEFYRVNEQFDRFTHAPPLRANVPMHREMLMAALHQNQAALFGSNLWSMAPDMVMPTCPAMNILVHGVTPYHMSAYAMLNEYTMLMRSAIARFSTPGVQPPFGMDNVQHSGADSPFMSAADLERAFKRRDRDVARAQMCCRVMSPQVSSTQLSDWTGGWFIPNAFCPIPANKHQLRSWYPQNDPALHPCVAQIVKMKSPSWTARIDAFGAMCERLDDYTKEHQKGKAKVKRSVDTEPTFDGRVDAYLNNQAEPDRSRAGRAETLMGLVVIWVYQCLIRNTVLAHHQEIERLRAKHGPGIDCGNGYTAIRPTVYYDQLWQACIEYTVRLLEIHELILLLINTRWITSERARDRLVPRAVRMNPLCVAKAHQETVKKTLARRDENIRHRVMRDAHIGTTKPSLTQKPTRLPDTAGKTFIGNEGRPVSSKDDWTAQHILTPVGRPDNPTYAQMILFDHTLDAATSDPAASAELTRQFKSMTIQANTHANKHPNWTMQHHTSPGSLGPAPEIPSDKRSRGPEIPQNDGPALSRGPPKKGKRNRVANE